MDLGPLPSYQWPEPPTLANGTVPPELVEQYKAQLEAHNEFIKQQLVEFFAASEHRRKLQELEYQAKIDTEAAKQQASLSIDAANQAADLTLQLELEKQARDFRNATLTNFHQAYIEVAKAKVDRAQKHAELLQAAAISIGTLYTGVLAYFFIQAAEVDKDNQEWSQLMPVRGIIPMVFLGTTIVFAMAYVAFRTVPKKGHEIEGEPHPLSYLDQQRNLFVEWVGYIQWWRAGLSQLAVISLGFAVATLPVAFMDITDKRAKDLTLSYVFIVLGIWALGWLLYGCAKLYQEHKKT